MSKSEKGHDTPAMRQFRRAKERHPDCVVFFRMGDFYETFFEDAVLAHKVMGVTLTQRTEGVPMAGVPYHAVEGYLRRMIQAGHRVAICDQVEDPAQAKGIVRREVTRVITPGTLTDESLLDEGAENPLAGVVIHDDGKGTTRGRGMTRGMTRGSIAWADLSTGRFLLMTVSIDALGDELARINPRELIYPESDDGELDPSIRACLDQLGCVSGARPSWQFQQTEAVEKLKSQFHVKTLEGFGLMDDDPGLGPAGGIIHYLLETQSPSTAAGGGITQPLSHLRPPRKLERSDHLMIDHTSLRSLEIERTIRSGEVNGSLLGVLQGCVTSMGKRLLRNWLCYPLRCVDAIRQRQRVVGSLVDDERFLDELRIGLDGVQDIERITGRVAVGRATPRDLVGLGRSAGQARTVIDLLVDRSSVEGHYRRLESVVDSLERLAGDLSKACVEAPPGHLREGGLIRFGFDPRLDEYRGLQQDGNAWLAQYQKRLIDETDISSLKVGFNRVFGYYIEVTAANKDKAPELWSRKQTLKNAERYITPELKEYEGKVLSARERAISREQELFVQLCGAAGEQLPNLSRFSEVVAELDVLGCFARRGVRHRYVCPTLVEDPVLEIRAGRHPVLDEVLGDQFVPNDVALGTVKIDPVGEVRDSDGGASSNAAGPSRGGGATLNLITGPNMAGKSTYIRQTALITLMAHTGSFVPADSATIGVCDRIFTRIGASDELHAGRSTFMVEMTETANICYHTTPHSLVILDEIGRGTSTLDGLSLAWAITEHLARLGCRTLFATHYHELTRLPERFANVANLNVAAQEWGDKIVFLHRILPGATDKSYGIHVAKLAGLPGAVVDRANQLLGELSVSHIGPAPGTPGMTSVRSPGKPLEGSGSTSGADGLETIAHTSSQDNQMLLFKEYLNHPVVDELSQLDLNHMTPVQAFEALRVLKQLLD